MAAFLFAVWDGGGTVGPALGLVRQLSDRGHDVRVLGSHWLASRVEAAGARFEPFASAPEPEPSPTQSIEDQVGEYLDLWFGSGTVEELRAALDSEAVDVAVIDCMYANLLAYTEHAAIPTATVMHMPYQPIVGGRWLDGWTWARDGLNRLRTELDLDPFPASPSVWREVWSRPERVIVTTTERFDSPGPVAPNTRYIGPVRETDDPADAFVVEGDEPLVVVSLSSSYMHQEDLLQRTLDATAQLPVRALVTTGPLIDPVSLRPPPNAVVEQWVPHDAVLPDADLVVTHAGHGTVMAALAHGVPLVCVPMGRDQHLVAERVEACGAGRVLDSDVTLSDLASAISAVIESSTYRDAATELASDIATHGNGRLGVEELEALTPNLRRPRA